MMDKQYINDAVDRALSELEPLNRDFFRDLPEVICQILNELTWKWGKYSWFNKAWEEYRKHVLDAGLGGKYKMPGFIFNPYIKEQIEKDAKEGKSIYHSDDELEHFGILGQKWGVRRFQNPDGTLTEEGKKRYSTKADFQSNVEKKMKPFEKQLSSKEKELSDLEEDLLKDYSDYYKKLAKDKEFSDSVVSYAKQIDEENGDHYDEDIIDFVDEKLYNMSTEKLKDKEKKMMDVVNDYNKIVKKIAEDIEKDVEKDLGKKKVIDAPFKDISKNIQLAIYETRPKLLEYDAIGPDKFYENVHGYIIDTLWNGSPVKDYTSYRQSYLDLLNKMIEKTDNSISHHGIKGQKWGVRRYQNEDGTLTNDGKARRDRERYQKAAGAGMGALIGTTIGALSAFDFSLRRASVRGKVVGVNVNRKTFGSGTNLKKSRLVGRAIIGGLIGGFAGKKMADIRANNQRAKEWREFQNKAVENQLNK